MCRFHKQLSYNGRSLRVVVLGLVIAGVQYKGVCIQIPGLFQIACCYFDIPLLANKALSATEHHEQR